MVLGPRAFFGMSLFGYLLKFAVKSQIWEENLSPLLCEALLSAGGVSYPSASLGHSHTIEPRGQDGKAHKCPLQRSLVLNCTVHLHICLHFEPPCPPDIQTTPGRNYSYDSLPRVTLAWQYRKAQALIYFSAVGGWIGQIQAWVMFRQSEVRYIVWSQQTYCWRESHIVKQVIRELEVSTKMDDRLHLSGRFLGRWSIDLESVWISRWWCHEWTDV